MEFGRALSKYQRTLLLTMMMLKLGVLCTVSAEKCLSAPCQNGGTCLESMGDYFCLCPQGSYRGKDCEVVDIDYCESNPCVGSRSRCIDGDSGHVCYCPQGYGGTDCQDTVRDCSEVPCHNGATCVPTPDGYECRCAPGYEGRDCKTDIDECQADSCQNGAICIDGINGFQCFCVPGFQGSRCGLDINECASRPCRNNGTCVDEVDHYRCDCLLGYKGLNCELEIDECEEHPCQNGATCHDHVGTYTCDCVPGFEGQDCQVNVDECASAPCLNDGSCIDLVNSYECDCGGTGFAGEHCEEDIPECASDPCQHGATCLEGVNQYSCVCWPGYEGENCQVDIDECEEGPCENDGECFQRSDILHYGVLPELDGEFLYEEAAGYLCHCLPGYTGESCAVDVDECEPGPCQNGGTCDDLVNAYQCVCPPGFTGVHCEENIDECESQPCQNEALCEDGVNTYTCHCLEAEPGQEPWGGRDCDVALIGCRDHECENGAACVPVLVEDQHDYTCSCAPGFTGPHCGISTTFSFSKEGYLLIQVPAANRTRRETETDPHHHHHHHGLHVQLRFRTTLPNVLLLYTESTDHSVSLEIVDGFLLASVESGKGLLVQHPVNDGDWYEASVTINETLVLVVKGPGCDSEGCMVENKGHNHLMFLQPGYYPQLYVGGHPLNAVGQRGFLGCMEDLQVDHQLVLPQDLPAEQARDLDLGCTKTEWCQPDTCSEHGRCVDLWVSSRCDCDRPYFGDSCEKEYKSWTFSPEDLFSYASYNITRNHGENFTISFFLRSLKPVGLLFQLRRADFPYFNIYLRNGTMAFSGHPTTILSDSQHLTDGQRRLVTVKVSRGHVVLPKAGGHRSLGRVVSVEAGDVAYVGGLPPGKKALPWGGHFKGCLQDIRLDQMHLTVGDHTHNESYGTLKHEDVLEDCVSDNACQDQPCMNGGTCAVTWNDFECHCPMNFSGRTCETRVWCVSEPCVMGSQCVDLLDGYECLTNATFEDNALQFTANNSLVEPVTSVSLLIRTREENGVLLRATSGADVFCLGLLNSSLLVKLRSGSNLELLAFTSESLVSDGTWHHLTVAMADPLQAASRWQLTVDGQRAGSSRSMGNNLGFLNGTTVWLAENFTGCLGQVRVGGVYLPLVDQLEVPQASHFLKQGGQDPQLGCTGAPVCQEAPCLNQGTCQDLFNLLNCSCAPGWEGELCQTNTDECASNPCVHGSCTDLLADYQCECQAGYGGKDCQEELENCLEHRCENGGSCLEAAGTHRCVCPEGFTGRRCRWKFPALECKDLECLNGGTCMNGIWGANCTCRPGYTGDKCETQIDECESNPCLNGATCVDDLDGFQCVCASGYSGATCESTKLQQRERVPWLVIAIPLGSLCVLLAIIALVFMLLTARRKRQSEGTYSPSAQEVAGARLEMGSVLKVPPEERLI